MSVRRFIYLRIFTRCGSVYFFVSRQLLSWYFFCFHQEETSFVLARERKKVLFFCAHCNLSQFPSVLCFCSVHLERYQYCFVFTKGSVKLSRNSESIFLLFIALLVLCLDSSPIFHFLGADCRNSLGRFSQQIPSYSHVTGQIKFVIF